jgi:cell division protein ZapA
MSGKDSSGTEPTSVTIFGRTYRLRGDDDPTYLAELAEVVDSRMKEVARETGTADTLKVAILTSLNLADDYLKASGDDSQTSHALDSRLARMVTRLDEVLAG